MRFTLTIDCDNDAFGPSDMSPMVITETMRAEVERILSETSSYVVSARDLYDKNGNKVGRYAFDPGHKAFDY